MYIASIKEVISNEQLANFISGLRDIPNKISETFKLSSQIEEIAKLFQILIIL